MNDFVQKPNMGSMFLSKSKKTEKSPDFYGSISVDLDYLKQLIADRNSTLIEIKLSAWKRATKNGDPWLSLAVDTFKKQETSSKDPWDK